MYALKILVFFLMLRVIYVPYTTFTEPSHTGRAVTNAYEAGNMKKLQLLGCKVYEPKDKNIDRGIIYEMKDGKKVVC